jgi:hypothetical protein
MVIMMVCVHYTCEWGGVNDGDGVGNEWYACCVCVCGGGGGGGLYSPAMIIRIAQSLDGLSATSGFHQLAPN